MTVDIRSATPRDVDVVIDILAEVSGWLMAKGISQWPARFPRDIVAETVDRGELYVAALGQELVATVTLQWSDPAFWGERDDAGFVHRLAVRRAYAGAGHLLIDWAEQQAARCGRRHLC